MIAEDSKEEQKEAKKSKRKQRKADETGDFYNRKEQKACALGL